MQSAQQPLAFYLPIRQPRTIPVFAGARRAAGAGARRAAGALPGSRALGRGRP